MKSIFTLDMNKDEGWYYTAFKYPAGEWQVRLTTAGLETIKNADFVRLIARIQDGEVMKLLQLIDALRSLSVGLYLPYMPYSRADRSFVEGDCRGLSTFLRLIETSPDVDYICTLDMHSNKVTRNYRWVIDVSPIPFIMKALAEVPKDTVILLPDEGARRYLPLSGGGNVLQCHKNRELATGKFLGFEVPDKESFGDAKSAIIIDDICDGGGTFIGIADKLKDYNLELYLYVTHGIFSKGLNDLFNRFKTIFTTNSFLSTYHSKPLTGLTVFPCEELLLGASDEIPTTANVE